MSAVVTPRSVPVPPRRRQPKNYRFDAETVEKLDELAALRERTATRVLEDAIADYYARNIKKLRAQKPTELPDEKA